MYRCIVYTHTPTVNLYVKHKNYIIFSKILICSFGVQRFVTILIVHYYDCLKVIKTIRQFNCL